MVRVIDCRDIGSGHYDLSVDGVAWDDTESEPIPRARSVSNRGRKIIHTRSMIDAAPAQRIDIGDLLSMEE